MRYQGVGIIHWCSYSPVLRDWLSNSWRSWSSNSVRRELGAGTIPRWVLYMAKVMGRKTLTRQIRRGFKTSDLYNGKSESATARDEGSQLRRGLN
jgi:hypothetical protein